MASSLEGLFRRVSWDDFKGFPNQAERRRLEAAQANAGPGKTVGMAGIAPDFTVIWGTSSPKEPNLIPVAGTSPVQYVLADTIVVTATVKQARSWKQIEPLPPAAQALLLQHEQGHYDATALVARDCFIALMRLKGRTFGSVKEGRKEAADIVHEHRTKLDAIQVAYDFDTTDGAWESFGSLGLRKGLLQLKWEGYFTRARTETRSPVDGDVPQSPDGVPYKKTLADILTGAGERI